MEMVSQVVQIQYTPEDPFYFPYQRYLFLAGGKMKHLTSTKLIGAQQRAMQAAAPTTTSFSLDAQGQLTIHRAERPGTEVALCTVNLQELKDPQGNAAMRPGDVLLTYFSGPKKPALQRLLRKT
jgi:hypothetical protein